MVGGTFHGLRLRALGDPTFLDAKVLPPMPPGRASAWCWSRFTSRMDVFWGNSTGGCVFLSVMLILASLEKKYYLLSIVVTC